MRRIGWFTAGVALLATALGAAPAREATRGYDILGDIPILDISGRVRPLQTLANEKVKGIYSRETIKLPGKDRVVDDRSSFRKAMDRAGNFFVGRDAKVVEKWSPVAAMIDWSARPDFWNEQEFILVEYLPLKRMILADKVRADLRALAAKTPSMKPKIDPLLGKAEFTPEDLQSLARDTGLSREQASSLNALAETLGQDHKWLSPDTLENATVTVDGRSMTFMDWFGAILDKRNDADAESMSAAPKLSALEEKASEVGERLYRYIAFRDHNSRGVPAFDFAMVPRPANDAYLKFTADAYQKVIEANGRPDLTPLQADAAHTLDNYLKDLQGKHQNLPGKDARFDAAFKEWLSETASWIPVRLLLTSPEEELAKAGLPAEKVAAFRKAYRDVEEAERTSPGALPVSKAESLVAAARALGADSRLYPTASAMARETHFNRFAPFFHAPEAYGFGLVLLLLSFSITAAPQSSAGSLRRVLYGLGMFAFLAGIALEVYGFYLRIRITGWAPVTNMYETVVWVALVVTILGLVFELISRKTYVALAACGVALLATVLAANVPLLDANIKTLPPVLRDNFWLTIHVLTIVSSYAAFALALGLGLLAIAFYLTATYRRTASFRELATPLLPGLPLLAVGVLGLVGAAQGWGKGSLETSTAYYLSSALAGLGGMLSIVGGYAVVGELANRAPRKAGALGAALVVGGVGVLLAGALRLGPEALIETATVWSASIVSLVGASVVVVSLLSGLVSRSYQIALGQTQEVEGAVAESASASHQTEAAASSYAAAGSSGGVATLARPSVAEIRARAAANRPKLDARGLAMQSTANLIKPIANFVYRAMQVGVLLVAAGTILGGVWADYSWGRFWGWDPKEVWALITLLVYLVPLHGRFAGWVNTFGLVAASVICFLSVLMAWYGVNFVLGVGLHSYGFTEGGGQGVVSACTLAILAVVGATAWRRSLSSRPEVAVA